MTYTYIDNGSWPAYTGIGNQFPPNLDNHNGADAGSDVFSQIGVNMMSAFFQTMLGTQHLSGNNASEIAQKTYAWPSTRSIGRQKRRSPSPKWAEE